MPDPQAPRIGLLNEGDAVEGVFLLTSCLLRQNAQGEAFLLGEIRDRSGTMGFISWRADAEQHQRLREQPLVAISGRVQRHRDRLQIVAQTVDEAPPDGRQIEDFLPAAISDQAEALAHLDRLIASIDNIWLRRVLDGLFAAGAVRQRFAAAPAATSLHHARPGGLLEHAVMVAELAAAVAGVYPDADRDLLVTGALVHDLGKIDELNWEAAPTYTTRGNLLGHTLLGCARLSAVIDGIADFPSALADRLVHLVASHHGSQEYGAARPPAFLEAIILHALDNLDASADACRQAVATDRGPNPEWTGINPMLGRRLYRGP